MFFSHSNEWPYAHVCMGNTNRIQWVVEKEEEDIKLGGGSEVVRVQEKLDEGKL